MTNQNLRIGTLTTAVAAFAASSEGAQRSSEVQDLILRIRNPDESVNGPACDLAGSYGAAAIKPLSQMLGDKDFETSRRAKRAMYRVVRDASAPGKSRQRKAVEIELVAVLQAPSPAVRRDVLWMLSEIGEGPAVEAMSGMFADLEVREDVRCCLLRIPGTKTTAALKKAFETSPEDFKYALADALRARGEKVRDYPSRKLVPTRQTTVTAIEKK